MTQQCSLDAEQIPTTYFVTAGHRSETLAPQNGIPRLTVKIFLDWNRSFTYRKIQHKIRECKKFSSNDSNRLIYKRNPTMICS